MASNKLRTRITYTSEVVDQMSAEDVRKAYSKLRHIAKQRYERLEKYGYQDRTLYKRAQRELKGLPTMKGYSDGDIRQLLLDTSRWLRDPRTKAAEVRRQDTKIARTFQDMGYKWINRDNIYEFLEFMNDLKEANGEKGFEYTKVAQAYNDAQRLNIPTEFLKKHFEEWITHRNEISQIQPTENNAATMIAVQKAWAPELKKGPKKYQKKTGPAAKAAQKALKRAKKQ